MLEEAELQSLIGFDVVDRDGKSVGNLEYVFNDADTGKPEWIGVFGGTIRHYHLLVPVEGVEREETRLRVPWTKEQVKSAPDYGGARSVSDDLERETYSHYGLAAPSTTGVRA
jgi:sporulation protein YlmC with PRC-barrel domain